MKKNLKAVFSIMLALVMALAALPVSALPRFEADEAIAEKNVIEPYWTVPEGYNVHDYTKCVEFLEQTDENGIKNGEKLSESYDPNDPGTWGTYEWGENCFEWTTINGEQRVSEVSVSYNDLCGSLDVADCTTLEYLSCSSNSLYELNASGCTSLTELYCYHNNIAELDVTGCIELKQLICYGNSITELDVSNNTEIEFLNCHLNNLTELDVSNNTALERLDCQENGLTELNVSVHSSLNHLVCHSNSLTALDVSGCTALELLTCYSNSLSELDISNCTALFRLTCDTNNLIELDVSNNTALEQLSCYANNLTSLDLSNNSMLAYDNIQAEGCGYVGYASYYYEYDDVHRVFIYAYPVNSAVFEGFYDENGALIAVGEWSDEYEGYSYGFYGKATGTVIARFSGGALPGDIDGSGSVSTADAITTLRLAMQLLDGGGMNTDAADMDGNGSITLADAILILRIAMGLA